MYLNNANVKSIPLTETQKREEKNLRKANNKIIGGIVLLAIVLVAVGYAAIGNVGLNITGSAKGEANKIIF